MRHFLHTPSPMNYYVSNSGGQVDGPYSLDALKNRLASRSISLASQVCEEGSQTWVPLASVFPPVSAPRPPSSAAQPPPKTRAAAPQEWQNLAARAAASAAPSQRSRVFLSEQEDLADVRSRSCYKTLRFVINLSALIGIAVAIVIPLLPFVLALINSSPRLLEAEGKFAVLIALGIMIGECILIIAARQMTLLFVDIADTLIFDHNRNRNA